VADQQDRLVLAGAVQPYNEILLTIIRPANVNVALGKSGIAETLCHGFGGRAHVSDRIRGVDFDQLLKDVVRELPGLVIDLG